MGECVKENLHISTVQTRLHIEHDTINIQPLNVRVFNIRKRTQQTETKRLVELFMCRSIEHSLHIDTCIAGRNNFITLVSC